MCSRSTDPGNISKGWEAAHRRDICPSMPTAALSGTPLVKPMLWIGRGIVGKIKEMHLSTKGLSSPELHFKTVKKLLCRNSNSSRVSTSRNQSKCSELSLCSMHRPAAPSANHRPVWSELGFSFRLFITGYFWEFPTWGLTVFASPPTTPCPPQSCTITTPVHIPTWMGKSHKASPVNKKTQENNGCRQRATGHHGVEVSPFCILTEAVSGLSRIWSPWVTSPLTCKWLKDILLELY